MPSGVTASFVDNVLSIKGPKGELTRSFPKVVSFVIEGNEIKALVKDENDISLFAIWGTVASHASNMVEGVSKGFVKKLEVQGVGFRAEMAGKDLKLALGFSHPVVVSIPANLKVSVEKNMITIEGYDKELVGQFAAKIAALKKPEPYKGKGIRYEGQVVPLKQGKKAVT